MSGYIAGFIALLVMSFLFSAAETAYTEANRLRIESAAEEGRRSAAAALRLLDRFDATINAILLGNSLANISAVAVAVSASVHLTESYDWIWLAALGSFLAILFCGEILPRTLAIKNANRIALSLAGIMRALTLVLRPFAWALGGAAKLLTAGLKGEAEPEGDEAAVEEL